MDRAADDLLTGEQMFGLLKLACDAIDRSKR
jgi:hypothetical protein